MKRFVWSCGVFATVVFAGATALDAQGVTTAAIAGVVTDSSGGPLEGGRVVAVHGPSGTAYAAVTRADGRITIPGMRVGGPYRVTAALVGYRREGHGHDTRPEGVEAHPQVRPGRAGAG